MKKKQIYLLIGAKGSGKSFIGSLFQKYFDIEFLRVENWVLHLKKGRSLFDENYIQENFKIIEQNIRKHLDTLDCLVFESIGLTEYFDVMLASLRTDFFVTTIGIKADEGVCLERVRTRDTSIHINVSDEQLEIINAAIFLKDISTDYAIENTDKSIMDLVSEIERILNKSSAIIKNHD